MRRTLAGALLLATLAACTGGGDGAVSPTDEVNGYLSLTLKTPHPDGSRYLVRLPAGYGTDTARRWPLVVYLHGQSSSGSLTALREEGLVRYAASQPVNAIVVAPLNPGPNNWFRPAFVDAVIREVSADYAVDARAVSLTGFSMGGFGGWATAQAYPRRFSALLIVAGALPNDAAGYYFRFAQPSDAEWTALLAPLAATPTRIYHSPDDASVPYALGQRAHAMQRAAGGQAEFIATTAAHVHMPEAVYTPDTVEWLVSSVRADADAAAVPIADAAAYTGEFIGGGIRLSLSAAAGATTLRARAGGAATFTTDFVHAGNGRVLGATAGRFHRADAGGAYQCFSWPDVSSGRLLTLTREGSAVDCAAD